MSAKLGHIKEKNMKKLALVLACLTFVLCAVASCGVPATPAGTGEYVPGACVDNKYSSDWLALKFVPTKNLYLSTSEEIDALLELSADMFYVDEETGEEYLDWARVATVYEMMATNTENGDSVIVMTEKLANEEISIDEYIEALKAQIDAQSEISATYSEPAGAVVAGADYTRFAYTINYEGVDVAQAMYLRKIGDRMVSICITAETEAAEADIMSCFKAK